jgi:hypothetical protein
MHTLEYHQNNTRGAIFTDDRSGRELLWLIDSHELASPEPDAKELIELVVAVVEEDGCYMVPWIRYGDFRFESSSGVHSLPEVDLLSEEGELLPLYDVVRYMVEVVSEVRLFLLVFVTLPS